MVYMDGVHVLTLLFLDSHEFGDCCLKYTDIA